MLFQFPVRYLTDAVRRERTRSRMYLVIEDIEVDIPFVTGEEAPVAIEWDGHIDPHGSLTSFARTLSWPEDGMMHTRFHGGRHWIPCFENETPNGRAGVSRFVTADFVAGLSAEAPHPLLGHDELGETAVTGAVRVGSDPFKFFSRLDDDYRSSVIAEATRSASELILVDDVFHRACAEPKLVLMDVPGLTTHRSFAFTIKPVVDQGVLERALDAGRAFPVGDFGAAWVAAEREAAAKSASARIVGSEPPSIKLDMAVFQEGPVLNRVDHIVAKYLKGFASVPKEEMPDAILYAFYRMRMLSAEADPARRLDMATDVLADVLECHRSFGDGWMSFVEGFEPACASVLERSISI